MEIPDPDASAQSAAAYDASAQAVAAGQTVDPSAALRQFQAAKCRNCGFVYDVCKLRCGDWDPIYETPAMQAKPRPPPRPPLALMPQPLTDPERCSQCARFVPNCVCGAGTYAYSRCTAVFDVVCVNCSSCPSGYYTRSACSPDFDTQCEICSWGT